MWRRTALVFRHVLSLPNMGYRAMLAHFIECVSENKPPSMSLAVARRDMQIVSAAYRSLESGAFEAVGVGR